MTKLPFMLMGICLICFSACEDDEPDPVYGQPEISISGDATGMLGPGDPLEVTLDLDAEGGNGVLIVNRDGGFLEEIALDAEATTYTYTGQTVPEDAEEGDEIVYEFILENTQELASEPVSYTASVAVYEMRTLGSAEVFEIALPADGIVPEGSTVKLASGRNYYLPGSIEFAPGSTFIIEEGVTVYIQSEGGPYAVDVQGTVDIQGTATAPVVMTSDKVLLDGQEPEPGDWEQFQIEGTGPGSNSGVVRYLRLEYGEEDVLELDAVGSETVIEYIQVFHADDEAFFIGDESDVNAKYLVATNAGDISFRLGDEFYGNLQFLLAHNTQDGGEAFYIRENAAPVIANVTIVGPGAETATEGFENAGIRFRATTGTGKVYNAAITALPDWGVRADDAIDETPIPAPTDVNGERVFAFSHVYGNDSRDDDDAEIFFTEPSFANSEEPIPGIEAGSFVPSATAASEFDPSTLGEFFDAAPFVGAIQDAENDWTLGWVRNADGSLRE